MVPHDPGWPCQSLPLRCNTGIHTHLALIHKGVVGECQNAGENPSPLPWIQSDRQEGQHGDYACSAVGILTCDYTMTPASLCEFEVHRKYSGPPGSTLPLSSCLVIYHYLMGTFRTRGHSVPFIAIPPKPVPPNHAL